MFNIFKSFFSSAAEPTIINEPVQYPKPMEKVEHVKKIEKTKKCIDGEMDPYEEETYLILTEKESRMKKYRRNKKKK